MKMTVKGGNPEKAVICFSVLSEFKTYTKTEKKGGEIFSSNSVAVLEKKVTPLFSEGWILRAVCKAMNFNTGEIEFRVFLVKGV